MYQLFALFIKGDLQPYKIFNLLLGALILGERSKVSQGKEARNW
jgi:hypothetical protein